MPFVVCADISAPRIKGVFPCLYIQRLFSPAHNLLRLVKSPDACYPLIKRLNTWVFLRIQLESIQQPEKSKHFESA